MIKHQITITFELDDKDYKRYDKNIDSAIDMILPYGADYEVHENEYEEDDEEDDLPEEDVEEFCIVFKDGREEYFDGQASSYIYFKDHKSDVCKYYRKTYKTKGGEVIENSSFDEIIYQDL